jgi:ariadne-1
VCMGPWSEHGNSFYQCNRFDEKSGIDARDTQAKSRASLERYLHVRRCLLLPQTANADYQYFNRWANHEQSAKLDEKFYKDTEKKMEAMQSTGNLSWIEVQFAKQAVEVCVRARITLKWSYAMAF